MKIKKMVIVMFAAAIALSSCKKEKQSVIDPVSQAGNVQVKFDYVFGSQQSPWKLNEMYVHPKTSDSLKFEMLKFYVSNIKLKREDGSYWTQPNSYHLVCTDCKESGMLTISDVPEGNYVGMEYTMGVDSFANVSGVYDGALSLGNGMFWDWNSGFIMLKVEGRSPNSPTGVFAFHLGGYKGADNIITTKSTDFKGASISVNPTVTPTITLVANPARFWHSATKLSVRSTIHAPGAEAKIAAKDFYNNIYFSKVN